MTTIRLDISTLGAANPAPPPEGFIAVNSTKTNGTHAASSTGAQATWLSDTELTGDVVKVKVGVTSYSFGGAEQGVMLVDSTTKNGFQITPISVTQIDIHAVTNGVKSGTALASVTTPALELYSDNQLELWYTKSTSSLQVATNGIAAGSPYVCTSILNTRGGAYAKSASDNRGYKYLEIEYTANQVIDTITDPMVTGSPFGWTKSGFNNPITSITSAGLSATSINDVANTAVIPPLTEGQVITTSLPATNHPVKFSDGTNSAVTTSNINLQAGYVPVTVGTPLVSDPNSPAFYITGIAAGHRLYYQNANGVLVGANVDLSYNAGVSPFTFKLFHHKLGGDNSLTEYNFTTNADGGIVNPPNEGNTMANVIKFDGIKYTTAPTLGTIAGKKIRVEQYMKLTKEDGTIWGQRSFSGRECCLWTIAGTNPKLFFSYGDTNLDMGTYLSIFGPTTPNGIVDFEYDPASTNYTLKLDGVLKKSGTFVGGAGSAAGVLWRMGSGAGSDGGNTNTGASGTIKNVNQLGDQKIWLNDVLVRHYVIPTSGTNIPDLVAAQDMTLRSGSGDDYTTQLPVPNYAVKNIVIIGASQVSRPLGTSLTIPSILGTRELMKAGLDGVTLYGWGHGGEAMPFIATKIPEAVNAFPNADTLFITELMGNDSSALRPTVFADLNPNQIN
jgi:hypothetical protein